MTVGYAGTSYEPRWTTAQVAEFLGVKPKTIHNRLAEGKFPRPLKQGRLNAFVPSEIVAYREQTEKVGV